MAWGGWLSRPHQGEGEPAEGGESQEATGGVLHTQILVPAHSVLRLPFRVWIWAT